MTCYRRQYTKRVKRAYCLNRRTGPRFVRLIATPISSKSIAASPWEGNTIFGDFPSGLTSEEIRVFYFHRQRLFRQQDNCAEILKRKIWRSTRQSGFWDATRFRPASCMG